MNTVSTSTEHPSLTVVEAQKKDVFGRNARWILNVFDRHVGGHGRRRFVAILSLYSFALASAFYFAYELRWDFATPDNFGRQCLVLLVPVVVCKVLLLYSFGQFRSILSYFGLADFGAVLAATGIVSGAMVTLWFVSEVKAAPPLSVIFMDFVLSAALLSGFRLSSRVARTWATADFATRGEGERRIVIIGAGDVGAALAKDLLERRGSGMDPIFFIDTDSHKIGLSIHGLPVFGPLEKLLQLGPAARINELVVAYNEVTPGYLYQIVEVGRQIGASTQIVPSFRQLASGEVKIEQFRPVAAENISRGLGIESAREAAGEMKAIGVQTRSQPVRSRIFLSPPHLGAAEFAYIEEAFRTNWIAPVGPNVDAFEREFCEHFGFKNAAALTSGTAAIHLAMRLLGVRRGDEVVCSTLTFAASANPIMYEGARPVLMDSDEDTWNMDPRLLEDWLDGRAKAGRLPRLVIAVDLYGQCARMDLVAAVCAKYGVPLIEDAAEALGGTCAGRAAGAFGQLSIFSFNGNKIITTSGGGMLVSDDANLIAEARFLATQARDPAPHYQHSRVGFNYRLSNVLAGIGRGQLQVLDARVAARRQIFERYFEALSKLPGVQFMPEAPLSRSNRWLSCLTIDPLKAGVDRERVRLALEADNIEARPVWKPLHLQPVFGGFENVGGQVSERLFTQGLCLPSGSAMTSGELDRVVEVVRGVFQNR